MTERTHWHGCWKSHYECAVAEVKRLRSLLVEARAEVEFWTPDECNAKASEERFLDLWYALRDRIDAALKEKE